MGFGFRVSVFGLRFQFLVSGFSFWFRVMDFGFQVWGFRFWSRVLGLGLGAWAYGCRVDGLRFLM